MNLADTILSAGADACPAILQRDQVVTYGQLRERVRQIASGLVASGYAKGDRIGILAENSPFFVCAYLGIIKAGLVVVPLQTDLTADATTQIASDANLKAIFVSQRLMKRALGWLEKTGAKLLTEKVETDWIGTGAESMPAINPEADLAALMFTSGSTGVPKGVMVSHRNIECNARDIAAYMKLRADDRVMTVLPFHYCFGASLLHTHLLCGGSLVLNNDFKLYPETVLQEMIAKNCTGLAGVPSTYQILLRKSRFRELAFPNLRWFQQAGGKLANPYIAEIRAAFPQVHYYLMYGQTEATARLSYLPPEHLTSKLGSIGKGLPSARLDVVKPDGTSVRPGSEETGEIVAIGQNVTLGYWKDPLETAKYFRDGRLYTGDIARVDSDGFIFIVEREREMIKSGGNRVSAKEIEDIIAEIPSVVEVAVIGVAHDLLGEAIRAFVVMTAENGITPQQVREHCHKRLPAFKVPEEVIFLKGLPHNASGKVIKQQLREYQPPPAVPLVSNPKGATAAVAASP